MARFRVWVTSCTLLMLIAAPVVAQSLPLSSDLTGLERLTRPAGIIFSGVVVRIEREQDENGKPASIRIALRAENAVRGCYAGETIEIAEWAELWARGDRYRVGQNAFFFLYPRNAAGLTSPVAGDLGVLLLASPNLLRLTPQQASFLGSQPGGRPTPGESTHPTKARVGLRSSPSTSELMRRLREAE